MPAHPAQGKGGFFAMTVPQFKSFKEVYNYLRPISRKRKAGFVYVIHAPLTGLFKVGQTTDIDKRLKNFQAHIPGGVELVHQFPTDDMDGAEAYWHMIFREKRVDKEWFRFSFKGDGNLWSIQQQGPWITDDEMENMLEIMEHGSKYEIYPRPIRIKPIDGS